MEDEAKLLSSILLSFEVLVVRRAIGRCRGVEVDPFCQPMPAVGVAVFGALRPNLNSYKNMARI